MADLGEIRARLVAETGDFEAGMQRAANATSDFSGTAEANIDQVNKSLKSINWREAGQSIAMVGGALKGIGDDFLNAAGAADDLADKLKGAFGDSADQVAQWSQDIGTKFQVFSAEQVGGAATALQKFGLASEENLRRVADVAAGSGQSIEAVAAAFGKFEQFGDSKSLTALQKSIGATSTELGNFGAVLDSSGKILMDTPARADAARAAMEAFLDDKFAGAMVRQSDASAQAAGSMELLKQEMGAGALELKERMAPALLEVLESFRGMPSEVKGAVGIIAEFGGTALTVGGQGLMMAANMSTLGLSITGIRTAMVAAAAGAGNMATGFLAMVGPLGVALIAVGALAAGFQYLIDKMNEASALQDKQTKADSARLQSFDKLKGIIGKSTDELKKMGITAAQVDVVIKQLSEGQATAIELGDSKRAARIHDQIAQLQKAKAGLPKDAAAAAAPKAAPRVETSVKEQAQLDKKAASDAAAQAKRDQQELTRQQRAAAQSLAREQREAARSTASEGRGSSRRRSDDAATRPTRTGAPARLTQAPLTPAVERIARQEAAASAPQATAPDFFAKFRDGEHAVDPGTSAFKELMARNAARAAAGSDVFLGGPSRAGALGALVGSTSAINPAAAAAVAGSQGASKSAAPASAEDVSAAANAAAKEGVQVTLTINEGGKSSTQTDTSAPGKPAKFNVGPRLGGVTG